MKTIVKNKIMQKIITIPIIILLLFNFVMPNYSRAADIGGVLLTPICDLLAALGDGVNWLLLFVSGEEQGSYPFKTGSDAYNYLVGHPEQYTTNPEYGGDAAEAGENSGATTTVTSSEAENYRNSIGTGGTKLIPITVSKYLEKDSEGNDVDVTNVGVADIRISPIEIFAGKVALLDANFFKETSEDEYNSSMLGTTKVSPAVQLRTTVSSWYQALRLIAIVGLLSVLAYIGIRIIISSAASDKAKYKQMLGDWVIALCLIFFLHYIMVFTMTMVEEITKIFVNDTSGSSIKEVTLYFQDTNHQPYEIDSSGSIGAIAEFDELVRDGDGWDKFWYSLSSGLITPINILIDYFTNSAKVPVVYSTNIIGFVRVKVASPEVFEKLTYTIMYLAMTGYTIYFMFIYIKRLITLILLTMIAPLVALTYPIDKIRDGKAQAFNYWLKEYMINAMLPIIHLVLYKVLITSALDLVATLPIYALAVMAFIVPAEKIIKSMFGIRSETAPSLGGFAGGALAAHTLSTITNKVGQKIRGGGKKGEGNGKIRTKDNKAAISSGKDSGKDSSIADIAGGPKQSLLGSKKYNEQKDKMNYDYKKQKRIAKAQTQLTPEQRKAQLEALRKKHDAEKKALKLKRDNSGRVLHNGWQKVRNRYSLPKGWRGVGKLAAHGAGFATKKLAKGAVSAAGVIAGGSIGLAGGIVSGDMSDMWKGLAGGAAAGGILGDAVSDRAESLGTSAFNLGEDLYLGEEEAQKRRAEKAFTSDYDNMKYMEKYYPELSAKEIKQELQTMSSYQESGITDIEQLDEMRKLEAKKVASGADKTQVRKDVINTAKLAKKLGESGFQDEKKREAAKKALTNALIQKQQMSQADAKKLAARKMKEAGEIVGYYEDAKP